MFCWSLKHRSLHHLILITNVRLSPFNLTHFNLMLITFQFNVALSMRDERTISVLVQLSSWLVGINRQILL